MSFQDIDHGAILFSRTVHALSFCSVFCRKTCFVFHCFLVYCHHYTSGMRDSVLQLGESILPWSFSLYARLPRSEEPLCSEKQGRYVGGEGATLTVYIGGEFWCILGLNVALFFISVFMSADFDWLWSCSLLPASFSCICFRFPSPLYLFAPLFANYDFAVFPDAFPLYNIRQKKKIAKRKKKIIWLIFHCS